jgi:hypothetical protein
MEWRLLMGCADGMMMLALRLQAQPTWPPQGHALNNDMKRQGPEIDKLSLL